MDPPSSPDVVCARCKKRKPATEFRQNRQGRRYKKCATRTEYANHRSLQEIDLGAGRQTRSATHRASEEQAAKRRRETVLGRYVAIAPARMASPTPAPVPPADPVLVASPNVSPEPEPSPRPIRPVLPP